MDIISLNPGAAAIFIDSRELDHAGLTPGALERDSASYLVSCALDDMGLALDGSLEIEAYTGNTGVMLFARIVEDTRVACFFSSLEDLCAAARALPRGIGSLCYIDGSWCLTLTGCERLYSGTLSEFGDLEVLPAGFGDHLAEHGQLIFPAHATARLLEYFS